MFGYFAGVAFLAASLPGHANSATWMQTIIDFTPFVAPFCLIGWLVAGLPIFVLGPLSKEIRSPVWAGLIGGGCGAVILLVFFHFENMLGHAGQSLARYILCAFVIGAVGAAFYVLLVRSLAGQRSR